MLVPPPAPPNPTTRVAGNAMRSRFEIVLHDARRDATRLRVIGESALEEIARVERLLSIYDDESDLFHANVRASGEPVRVQAITMRFLRRAAELARQTDGAFDLSVAPLVRLWRDRATNEDRVPTADEIADALALVGMGARVSLDDDAQTVAFDRIGVRLDPGAMGKGLALERAADVLRDCGITSALLHGGTSSVCAIGNPPDDPRGWRIALRHPTREGVLLAETYLRDCALGVSAVHGRTFHAHRSGDVRFGHVLDARTGLPVRDTLLAAIVAPDAADADALSTALLVLGSNAGLPLLRARFPACSPLTASAPNADGHGEPTVDKHDSEPSQWRVLDTIATNAEPMKDI